MKINKFQEEGVFMANANQHSTGPTIQQFLQMAIMWLAVWSPQKDSPQLSWYISVSIIDLLMLWSYSP